jgi:glutamate formiminotransferase
MPTIECVPNISEGRSAEAIGRMADAVSGVVGVALLDRSSDSAHHRSVFTIGGDSAPLQEAILRLVSVAVEVIDLRAHRGVHPRVGAVDVIPFVPLASVTMAECVSLARHVGRAIGDQFAIPVYLYAEASNTPARRHLADIRRGGFESLPAKMRQPGWEPDFGPPAPHPTAGATVVGARRILIAYNVNLATPRLDVARRIASVVRERGGGFPCVKALGLALEGRGLAQVSMNLTDYERTPPHVVFDRIVSEAARDGVEVLESELVGLIPAAALAQTTAAHLRLRDFSENRILENRLRAAGLAV